MKLNTHQLSFVPILFLPLLAFHPVADEVAFQPAKGASVSKELTFSSTFYLDDAFVSVDGQELPPEMLGSAMEEGLLFEASVSVTDEYVSTKDGKVLDLLRTFDSLSLEAGPESAAESVEEFAELEDTTVSFLWDEDDSEYIKSFHESEGDEGLLENLDVDMDFLALLPKDTVSDGDTWEVKGKGLGTIFLPGGVPASPDTDNEEAAEMTELLKEELGAQMEEAFGDFTVRCTYAGSREQGDVELGVIQFEFEGEAAIDLSEVLQTAVELQGGDMGINADVAASLALEFEATGTLLWDLKAGHAHNFELKGEMAIQADIEADIDAQGENHSAELSAEIACEMAWAMSTESGGDE
jgi:hypothetical protein